MDFKKTFKFTEERYIQVSESAQALRSQIRIFVYEQELGFKLGTHAGLHWLAAQPEAVSESGFNLRHGHGSSGPPGPPGPRPATASCRSTQRLARPALPATESEFFATVTVLVIQVPSPPGRYAGPGRASLRLGTRSPAQSRQTGSARTALRLAAAGGSPLAIQVNAAAEVP
jgi:hypothetical protein